MISFKQRSNEIKRERLTPLPLASREHDEFFTLRSSSKGVSVVFYHKPNASTAIFFTEPQPRQYTMKQNVTDVFTFDEHNRLWGFDSLSERLVVIDPFQRTIDSLPAPSLPRVNSMAVTDKVGVVGDAYTSADGPAARLCEYFYDNHTVGLIRSVSVPGYHLDNLKPTPDYGWLCSWIWEGRYRLLYLPPDDNRFFDIYQAERPIALMGSSPSDLYYVLEDWEKGLLLYTDDPRERWYGVQLPNTTGKSRIIALEVMVERVFVIAEVDNAFYFMDLSRASNPLIGIFRDRVELGRVGNELLLYGGEPICAIEVSTSCSPAIPPNEGYLLYSPTTDSFQTVSFGHASHHLGNGMRDMPNHDCAQRGMATQN